MIEKRIKYYCTDCNIEYDSEKSIGVCTNHHEIQLCEECRFICDEKFPPHMKDQQGINTTGEGCHKLFCEECIRSCPFDSIYPVQYCKDCLEKVGIDPWNYSDEAWDNEYSEQEEDKLLTIHEGPNKFYTKWKENE